MHEINETMIQWALDTSNEPQQSSSVSTLRLLKNNSSKPVYN